MIFLYIEVGIMKIMALEEISVKSNVCLTLLPTILFLAFCGRSNADEIRGIGNKCLDVSGGGSEDGTPVIIWSCYGGANQQWTFTNTGEIQGIGNKCLDVSGGGSEDGTPVIIWSCHGGANQQWTFTNSGEIQGIGNKCLDVSGGGSEDGTPVIIWSCHGGANQMWNLGSVFLSWNPSTSQDVIGYNAYRSTVSGGPYTELNSTLITTTNYTDQTVQSGYTYYYVTTAVNSLGLESAYSNEAAATVP